MSQQKKQESKGIVFHFSGNNSRVNVNSVDHSTNVVNISSEEIFANLRERITSGVPEEEEQTAILERLTALEQAQGVGGKSMFDRYTEFMSVAADHMTVIGPLLPALTQLIQKAL